MESACLLHDIGNPPFGHLGEFAIQHWFATPPEKVLGIWSRNGIAGKAAQLHFAGFEKFDGHAQGFRIVSKLQWLDNPDGLNLTGTLLASILKYLSPSPPEQRPFARRVGFYEFESDLVVKIWKDLGLKMNSSGLPLQRHPFAFIMEAADDIAYCVNDIEDAIEKRVVSAERFWRAWKASSRA